MFLQRKIKNYFSLAYINLRRVNFKPTKTSSKYFFRLTHKICAKKALTSNGEHEKPPENKKRQTALHVVLIVLMP